MRMESSLFLAIKAVHGDFPGSPVVKNSPSNAGDVVLIPGRRTKIPHAVGPLSLCATSREPECHKLQSPHHN